MKQLRLSFDEKEKIEPEVVHAIVEPALPRLRGLVRDVFQDMLRRRQSDDSFAWLDEGQSAWWMASQILNTAKRDFHGEPSLIYQKVKQQDYVVVCEGAIVVFKKLRQKKSRDGHLELVTSNYRTNQNKDFWGQRAIEGIPDLPRVIVGYEFLHALTDIRCFLGLPRGSNETLQWHREIDSPQGFEDGFESERTFEQQPTDQVGFEIEELSERQSSSRA